MSMMVVYGPRTVIYWTVRGNGPPKTIEATLMEDGWKITKEKCEIQENSKIFSPANLRSMKDNKFYASLINEWMTGGYTLRYTGGLVPDIAQIFCKGQGVFCNAISESAPAKLRLVFEVAPIALLVEGAHGKTSDGKISLLDVPITHMEQRCAFCAGSKNEVLKFEKQKIDP
eukprot:GHVL01006759.1.p1 GENE.GHVL01006759.1~~GHVL01006759.1.p1  ORF type:complete len:172 (-),score=28.71 GHVL01006759.1:742-1257(-)